MYLSRLKLHGFKSFADDTSLDFDPGVTAIVGPNGCGKSNIVDAVRWAIGEQRPTVLRSEKMENVIFNGTADRKPLGMAEVQLTIENNRGILPTEYSEVTIGRRLFRDGKSEYLMNGTQCRLKDITDLFMDTGMGADAYSVIELKMIDEILSGSTEDRRRMFEEAAGITRYKMRRRQALRKLDNTQTDLDRIRDLTDEIGTQVRRLKRQAEKAQKYNDAKETLNRLELLLSQVEFNRLRKKQQVLEEKAETQSDRATALQEDEEKAEAALQEERETLQARETALQDKREALQAHRDEIRDLETERRLTGERLERARRDLDRARQAQEEASKKRDALVDQKDRLESTIEQARPALDEARSALEAAEAERDDAKDAAEELRASARDVRRTLQSAEDAQAKRRRTLDRLTNRRELLEEEQERARTQADDLQGEADVLDTRVEEAETRRDAAQSQLDAAREALSDAEDERAALNDDVQTASDRLRDAERRRDAVAAEVDLLDGLVSSYEEFSDAVQFLASDGPLPDLKTVADLLACDEDVRVALDAALGDLASCVVVPDAETARAAISRLREAEKGQATFLLLDRLPTPPADGSTPNDFALTDSAPNDASRLRSAVRTPEGDRYGRLADVLLHDCYLADSLEAAQDAAAPLDGTARVFAPSGEWVDARGVVKGGSRKTSASPVASRLGRREQLEQRRQELDALQQECDACQSDVDAAQEALDAFDLEPYRVDVEEAEAELAQAEKRLTRVQYERESVDERRDELRSRADDLDDELAGLRERIETLRDDVHAAEDEVASLREKRADLEDALDAAEERERSAVSAYSNANVAAMEASNRLDNLGRDLERTRERITDIDRQTEQRREEIDTLKETIRKAKTKQSDLDDTLDDVRREEEQFVSAVSEAQDALDATKASISDVETRLREIRRDREEAVKKENEANVQLAEIKTRTQDLVESVLEDFDRDIASVPVTIPEDFDEKEAQSEVRSLRSRINRLGNVNPLALEEYEEEKERLDFLTEQQDDLEDAEETLMETISEINETAAERFFETYDQIKDSFATLFTELFGEGASAELKLEDPDDPLDSAIDIIAQPKGKRPVTLEQLSSGEKTLTAIALLFAIYLVKPSPFCILDEVDAPLDDANVERFMNLVRRFEDETQFIMVTHNQRTMALADRMYGVTMQEQGVSQLVGVQFDEAVEMAG